MTMPDQTGPDLLCRHCDVFVGWAGAGVVEVPTDKPVDWLATHCWLCGRSADEVREAPRG